MCGSIAFSQKMNQNGLFLIQMKTEEFVTMMEPDCDNIWLEFKIMDEVILISEIRAEEEMCVVKTITNMPKRQKEFFWSESILKEEFISQVFAITSKFIQDILSLNKILATSREIMELNLVFQKAKEIWLYI